MDIIRADAAAWTLWFTFAWLQWGMRLAEAFLISDLEEAAHPQSRKVTTSITSLFWLCQDFL